MRTLAPLPSTQIRVPTAAVLLSISVIAAAALRIPGIYTNFWGDEIWSWSIAGQLHSALDVLMAEPAHIDNNHPLNTLFLYLMGQDRPVWLYRLPALLAGMGSVVLAARIMLRRGRNEAIIAAVLIGCSYPLIFYSSEARGYSLAVFFSLLSFDLLRTALARPIRQKRATELFFGLACVAGFLSHLTFLHIYAGALVWSIVRVRSLEPTTRLRGIRLARLHAIPMMFALLLFRFFIRDMVVGGAAPTVPAAVFLQSLSFTAGGPEAGWVAVIVAIFVALIFISAMLFLIKEGSSDWTFFLTAVLISPALACTRDLCFSDRPQPLMLRYFLVCIAMLLLSVCPMLAFLWQRGGICRLGLGGILIAFIVGNVCHLESFLMTGRGHYAEALKQIADQTPGTEIAISSDNPLRTNMLVQFYGPRVAPGRKIVVDGDPHGWLIFNRIESGAAPIAYYRKESYSLMCASPSCELSGWGWQVYRAVKN